MTLSSGPQSFAKLNVLAMVRKLIDDESPLLSISGAPVDGVDGTYAEYPVGKGALLIDIESGILYINAGVQGSPIWNEFVSQSHSEGDPGLGIFRTAKGSFDATIDNISTGTHPFLDRTPEQNAIAIPLGAIAVFGIIDTTIALTSAGAPVVGLSLDNSVVEDNNIGVAPWIVGLHNTDDISDWQATSYLKMINNGVLAYNIGGATLTGGQFDVYYFYIG